MIKGCLSGIRKFSKLFVYEFETYAVVKFMFSKAQREANVVGAREERDQLYIKWLR